MGKRVSAAGGHGPLCIACAEVPVAAWTESVAVCDLGQYADSAVAQRSRGRRVLLEPCIMGKRVSAARVHGGWQEEWVQPRAQETHSGSLLFLPASMNSGLSSYKGCLKYEVSLIRTC